MTSIGELNHIETIWCIIMLGAFGILFLSFAIILTVNKLKNRL